MRPALIPVCLLLILGCTLTQTEPDIQPFEAESILVPTEIYRDYFMVPVSLGGAALRWRFIQ